MYKAEDIKRRIEELHHMTHLRQMDIIEGVVKKMYDNGLSSMEFSIEEDFLELSIIHVIDEAGFSAEHLGDRVYRLYITEEV